MMNKKSKQEYLKPVSWVLSLDEDNYLLQVRQCSLAVVFQVIKVKSTLLIVKKKMEAMTTT